jgi:hypothetical protein
MAINTHGKLQEFDFWQFSVLRLSRYFEHSHSSDAVQESVVRGEKSINNFQERDKVDLVQYSG